MIPLHDYYEVVEYEYSFQSCTEVLPDGFVDVGGDCDLISWWQRWRSMLKSDKLRTCHLHMLVDRIIEYT